MSKSLREYIHREIIESTPEIEEQRKKFASLVAEQESFDVIEYSIGKDIGRHILYMYSVGEGDNILYPPIIEAEINDSGIFVPKNCELNLGLFEVFKLKIENPNEVLGGFTVEEIDLTVKFEDVPHWRDLKPLEKNRLADRIYNYPFLRAIKTEV
jgi:hypothetical protein